MPDFIHVYMSPLGKIIMGSDGESIIGLWFEGQKHFESTLSEDAVYNDSLSIFQRTDQWLNQYFDGKKPETMPSIEIRGTVFQSKVWQTLKKIPYGTVVSYQWIADQIDLERKDHKTFARAVGNAVGHNPVSILIPCHRVIRSDGGMGGYAGGIERKKRLLAIEGINLLELH